MKRVVSIALAVFSANAAAATLDQLAAMQTVVRAEIEGARVCEAEFKGLPKAALSAMPQLLEARIREKLEALSTEEKKRAIPPEAARLCEARCRCGIYAQWIGERETDAGLRALRGRLAKAAGRPLRIAKCAQANRAWVCKHPEFRAAAAEARKAAEENGS